MKMINALVLLSLAATTRAHEYFTGSCPALQPMAGFSWERFTAVSRWYATEKFDVSSSKCLTYEFTNDADNFRLLIQRGTLKPLRRLGSENQYTYRGRISLPNESVPGKMKIRFTLNPFGNADMWVLDTDYDSYALVCNCQQMDLFILTAHRRSCTILQRNSVRDADVAQQLKNLLDNQVGDDDEPASHDFDPIDHSNCEYDGEGLSLDVEKLLGFSDGSDPVNVKDYDLSSVTYSDPDAEIIRETDLINRIRKENKANEIPRI